MLTFRTLGPLALALPLLACSLEADDAGRISLSFGKGRSDEFHWNGPVAAGQILEVKGVNGAVRAEAASGSEAEVVAERSSRRSNPADVNIVVVEHAGGVTICAVYPDRPGEEPNECLPGDAGHLGARGNSVKVDFIVRVPDGVSFRGRTVNGRISAEGLTDSVDIRTVNGAAAFSTSGYGVAGTVNGSITGSLGRTDWAAPLEFETVNGSITLEIDGDVDADVEMRTVNGSLNTDFPLTVQGSISRRRLSGTIGDGGRQLSLSTVNGSIELRRGQ